jgi:hypothetical protein
MTLRRARNSSSRALQLLLASCKAGGALRVRLPQPMAQSTYQLHSPDCDKIERHFWLNKPREIQQCRAQTSPPWAFFVSLLSPLPFSRYLGPVVSRQLGRRCRASCRSHEETAGNLNTVELPTMSKLDPSLYSPSMAFAIHTRGIAGACRGSATRATAAPTARMGGHCRGSNSLSTMLGSRGGNLRACIAASDLFAIFAGRGSLTRRRGLQLPL